MNSITWLARTRRPLRLRSRNHHACMLCISQMSIEGVLQQRPNHRWVNRRNVISRYNINILRETSNRREQAWSLLSMYIHQRCRGSPIRLPQHFHADTNRSNQNVLDCPFQGGEVDSEHISIAHIERLTPIK